MDDDMLLHDYIPKSERAASVRPAVLNPPVIRKRTATGYERENAEEKKRRYELWLENFNLCYERKVSFDPMLGFYQEAWNKMYEYAELRPFMDRVPEDERCGVAFILIRISLVSGHPCFGDPTGHTEWLRVLFAIWGIRV